jgi:hypothetical protein
MLREKLWPFCDMKRMIKWTTHSITTSRAEPKKVLKLTRALVLDLDEGVKEVKLLGEHGEEASHKITELEALCKRLREDAQKLREEKTKLEGMVEYRNELIMEITDEIGLNRMGEDTKDKEDNEDKDYDVGGDTATPPVAMPPPIPALPATTPEVSIVKDEDPMEMVPEQEGMQCMR